MPPRFVVWPTNREKSRAFYFSSMAYNVSPKKRIFLSGFFPFQNIPNEIRTSPDSTRAESEKPVTGVCERHGKARSRPGCQYSHCTH